MKGLEITISYGDWGFQSKIRYSQYGNLSELHATVEQMFKKLQNYNPDLED